MHSTMVIPTPATHDVSRAVLDLVHRLLVRPPTEPAGLPALLAELAGLYQVGSAHLASLPEGQIRICHPTTATNVPGPLPWRDDPSLLARLRQSPGALVLEQPSGCILLTRFTSSDGGDWALWLEDDQRTSFPEAEVAALALAGIALGRLVGDETSSRWAGQLDLASRQQRLESVAGVTRRLAHDFGNVLTGILGFTELALAQQIPANTSLHSYLSEVYRAAQSGAQFIHQLRLFSRRQSASSRPGQLASVLTEQEARLFAVQPAGLNLRLAVPTDLPPVALDAEHLHQVLTALLDNAREALVGPGVISVSARVIDLNDDDCLDLYGAVRPGPHVEVIIADTGTGLSPEVQRRLFVDPFYTTKPRRRGFGLAVAYGILHAHHGGLRLHPGEERGVVARLVLPVAPTPVFAVPVPEVVRPSERLRNERILVVDDEQSVLSMVSTALERSGFRVQTATGAEEALQLYFAQGTDPFRLVLTDVLMPEVNGVELARRLLKRDPGVRVLFMSGHVSSEFTQPDFVNYAIELLAKPFRPEQLVRAVRTALDRPSSRRPIPREAGPHDSSREAISAGTTLSGVSKK